MRIEDKIKIGKKLQEIRVNSIKGIAESGSASNLVTPQIIGEILTPKIFEGTVFERCNKFQVSPDHNFMKMVYAKEVDRTVASGIAGGVKTYLISETGTVDSSIPAFGSDTLVLNKLGTVIRATDEIVSDAVALSGHLHTQLKNSLRYYVDHYIIYGNGSEEDYNETGDQVGPSMHGIANSGNRATKFITTANPITLANVRAMVSAYYGGTNGIFVMAQDAYEKIVDLANANNSFNALKFHVINNEVKAFLFGYEILVKDCMNSGDIALIDPSAYTVVLIDPKTDVSSDVYFLTQENCYRSILRINGMPNWVGGITGQNGVTRYPFVMNASADEQSSSSSSSSSSSMD